MAHFYMKMDFKLHLRYKCKEWNSYFIFKIYYVKNNFKKLWMKIIRAMPKFKLFISKTFYASKIYNQYKKALLKFFDIIEKLKDWEGKEKLQMVNIKMKENLYYLKIAQPFSFTQFYYVCACVRCKSKEMFLN